MADAIGIEGAAHRGSRAAQGDTARVGAQQWDSSPSFILAKELSSLPKSQGCPGGEADRGRLK